MYHLPKRRPKNRRRRWGGHLRVHKGDRFCMCVGEFLVFCEVGHMIAKQSMCNFLAHNTHA